MSSQEVSLTVKTGSASHDGSETFVFSGEIRFPNSKNFEIEDEFFSGEHSIDKVFNNN